MKKTTKVTTTSTASTPEDAEVDSIFAGEGKPEAVKPGKGAQATTPRLGANTFKGGFSMKRVQSTTCPTCGTPHPSGTVQTYEVPEFPVVDESLLKGVRDEIAKLGASAKDFDKALAPLIALGRANQSSLSKLQEMMGGHPKPTEDLLKTWQDCPECKAAYEKMKSEIEQAALAKAVNPHPVAAEHIKSCPECQKVVSSLVTPPKPETVAAKPRFFWEK